MIKIIKSGKEKVFVTTCANCATDFEYRLEDVSEKRMDMYSPKENVVKCPECGKECFASMLTADEQICIGVKGFYNRYNI